ncbi:MAG: polysaccharide biosynthesis tyrosine autokinase [Actinomycetota bacterium]|nr:polysaccharide biosynthesis tyrosine autokinase [Actinomycetota bacterium]
MNFSRILVQLRNSWRLLTACALLGLLAGGAITLLHSKAYEASAEVLVSPNAPLSSGTPNIGDAYSAGLFTVQRAQSYVEVATTPDVLGPVADKIHAKEDKVEAATVAAWVPGTSLVKITVTWANAKDAAVIANGAANQLAGTVDTIERARPGVPAVVKVTTVRPAKAPLAPVRSNLLSNLLVGLTVGLLIGIPLVLAKVLLDRSVTDGKALTQAIGEPPLGLIGDHGFGVNLLLREQPDSRPAEAIRKLRTAIQFAQPDAPARSLVVASPQPGGGSSTVAANLAVAVAEAGRRVVLVDGNMRFPAAGRMFGLKAGAGVTELLSGDADLAGALHGTDLPGLSILLAGQARKRPGSALAGPPMVALLERLEAQADLVIIDAPAVLPFAEAAELAAIADGALLVIRYGRTLIDEVRQAQAALSQVHANVVGVVINGVPGRNPDAVIGAGTPALPVDTQAVHVLVDRPAP